MRIRVFYFHAFNFRHLSNQGKFFNGENFPNYGIEKPQFSTLCVDASTLTAFGANRLSYGNY